MFWRRKEAELQPFFPSELVVDDCRITLHPDGMITGDTQQFVANMHNHKVPVFVNGLSDALETTFWLLAREIVRQKQEAASRANIANAIILLQHMVGVVVDGGKPDPTDVANCKELLEKIKYPKDGA